MLIKGVIKVGLIGNEIIQSRAYIDPSVSAPPPNLNYRNTFPITVFEAVRELMKDENSPTLREVLDNIHKRLDGTQPLIPAKPANYLMTYAGVPGGTGSIEISQDVPWDRTEQRHDRIPTEKAVGDLMFKLGLINENGDAIDPGSRKVNWTDIIGRPLVYNDTGNNDDGFITQKAVTKVLTDIRSSIDKLDADSSNRMDIIEGTISDHIGNTDNPHNVSIFQIGAASQKDFMHHITNAVNPHRITPEILGLGHVDDTSDLDKPISNATQAAIDSINILISKLAGNVENINGITDVQFNSQTGGLKISYMDNSEIDLQLPLDRFVDTVKYDKVSKELVITEYGESLPDSPGTHIKRVDLSELFIRYIGSVGTNIHIEIDGNQLSGEQTIRASIIPKSITGESIADNTVTERIINDQAVSVNKIKDASVTTVKIADGSITTTKIADCQITNGKIASRSIDGRTLFSSIINNRVLVTHDAGEDPYWGQVIGDMIADKVITSRHIENGSINTEKIANGAISSGKLADGSVISDKLAPSSVTNEKISNQTITGEKIAKNVKLYGTPSISVRPSPDSNDNSIVDTRWVRDHVADAINKATDFGSRMVDGKMLFSSPYKNRVLTVRRANGDAEWGLINHEMLEANSVNTDNLIDRSVTADKIKNKSILAGHLTKEIVNTDNIIDSAVTSEKIFPSNMKDMVLGSLSDYGHPVYTKVTRNMIEYNAISSMQIEDRSVTLAKLQTADTDNKVLAVDIRNTNPIWTQVNTRMIADRAVNSKKLFTSAKSNMVLGVSVAGDDPKYMKVNSEMLDSQSVRRRHIGYGEVYQEHLQEKIIESRHIMDWSIQSNNIAHRAITGIELFSSPVPNRVLAVTTMPYSNPDWLQVTGDMIENNTITPEKLFSSIHSNRILGVKKAGSLPEYMQITGDFIEDDSITGSKISKNVILRGTPKLESDPLDFSNNNQIATTRWVRKTISSMTENLSASQKPTQAVIDDESIDISKLKPTKQVGVLTSREQFGKLEFSPVTEDVIANGSITTKKIGRDLMLLGNPVLEVRPSATASDKHLNGNLIPDCQWVLDRIQEAISGGTESSEMWEMSYDTIVYNWESGYGYPLMADDNELTQDFINVVWNSNGEGSILHDNDELSYVTVLNIWNSDGVGNTDTGKPSDGNVVVSGQSTLKPGSVTNEMLGKRAVSADKMFSSSDDYQVLAVISANTDPVYTKITGAMIEDGEVTFDKLQAPNEIDVVMGVINPDDGVQYTKVTGRMIENGSIKTSNISDGAITSEKLADGSIDHTKFAKDAFVNEDMLMDNSVSTQKIQDSAVETDKLADRSVTNEKIADETISGDKLINNIELPGSVTVASTTKYETRQLRNTILSTEIPDVAVNGDIWFRYV